MRMISFHAPDGKLLLVRADVIYAVTPNEIRSPNGGVTNVTCILIGVGQIPVKESIEEVEAALAEPDFGADFGA